MSSIMLRKGETLEEGLNRKIGYRQKQWERDRSYGRYVLSKVRKREREEAEKCLANDWQTYKSRRKLVMDFSKFDKQVDLEGLKKDIEESTDGDFKEVPLGNYEVAITKLELAESKKGDPMVKVWFKIVSGEYKGSLLFMNQVITKGFQIHIVDEFLRSLETDIEISFESYSQYNELLMDVFEAIDGNYEYALEYGEKKGFNTFKITDVFELD